MPNHWPRHTSSQSEVLETGMRKKDKRLSLESLHLFLDENSVTFQGFMQNWFPPQTITNNDILYTAPYSIPWLLQSTLLWRPQTMVENSVLTFFVFVLNCLFRIFGTDRSNSFICVYLQFFSFVPDKPHWGVGHLTIGTVQICECLIFPTCKHLKVHIKFKAY